MNFTVAVIPTTKNLVNELQYIKSALLYADKISLISPLAYTFTLLADEKHVPLGYYRSNYPCSSKSRYAPAVRD